MSSFKKLNQSDVSVVTHYANKQWEFYSASLSSAIKIYNGLTTSASLSLSSSATTTDNQYQQLIGAQINHLFYQSYSSSLLNTSSLANSIYYESASQQRPTASYFIYNDSSNFIKAFPTGNLDTIKVLAISQDTYGNKILPYTFNLTSSAISIIDDGYGNLVDISGTPGLYISASYISSSYFASSEPATARPVGNIFYSHGLAILTNQNPDYQNFFDAAPWTCSFKNEHNVYENEIRCLVKESDFNLSYNPTIVTNYASGSVKDFATGSNFYTYATTLGLYNDNNELLVVAKFGKPMLMSPDTDMTFVIQYDT
jgi:hypothetical protein